MLLGLLLLLQQDSSYTRIETLLAAHDLAAARRAAEHVVAAHPRDAQAHLLLGRVWYAWPITGRYDALREFRIAARLAPAETAPLTWQVRVGEYLRSDEGERIMREALLKLLAIARGGEAEAAWSQFRPVFHSLGILRDADAALASQGDDPMALVHRAELALEAETPARADSLATRSLERHRPDVLAYVVRARANFEARKPSAGYAWYDSALVHAELDSTDALWRTVLMIATPDEVSRYRETPPTGRRVFFERFWSVRDPNLVTPKNERIAEHFERLAYARRQFRLLHPWATSRHSASARVLGDMGAAEALNAELTNPGVPLEKFLDAIGSRLPGEDVTDSISRQLLPSSTGQGDDFFASGLDARGILWVRHGKPTVRAIGMLDALSMIPKRPGRILPVESWLYDTPEFTADVAFLISGGDLMVTPITHRQRVDLPKVARLFRTNATSLPAPLEAHAWSAFFAAAGFAGTDVYCKAVPDTAAAVLWTEQGAVVDRAHGPGLLRLTARPGIYQLGLDVDSGGVLGRVRREVRVPAFAETTLALSSLALAPGDTLADRDAELRDMPADLVYSASRPLVAYTEIYGLANTADPVRYTVRYAFTPMEGGRPVMLEFVRERAARAVLPEQIVIEPGRIPAGRYRVSVEIAPEGAATRSHTAALEIAIQ